jgi:hypothetical protein
MRSVVYRSGSPESQVAPCYESTHREGGASNDGATGHRSGSPRAWWRMGLANVPITCVASITMSASSEVALSGMLLNRRSELSPWRCPFWGAMGMRRAHEAC